MLAHRGYWLAGGWLLVSLVVYLSITPNPPNPVSFAHVDKIEHGFAYATLSLWFCQIYLRDPSRMIVVASLVAMGISLEFIQGWSGFRYFDIWDMLANSLGVFLGYGLAYTALGRLFIWIESAWRKIL